MVAPREPAPADPRPRTVTKQAVMCGIAGLLSFSTPCVDKGAVVRMTDAMAHRGPDGDGVWVGDDSRIGLGHRRLAIVDLTPDAAQPMTDAEGDIHLTFNGEIYNHLALRAELVEKGYRFRTDHSDTEVILHGFKEWGLDGLVERLLGMFAFAVWDRRSGILSLARDRVGIKPIYFCHTGGMFRFASEIKALLTDPAVPRAMNPTALRHYLSFMVTPAPLTLFRNIWKLPAGHVMEVARDGRMTARRTWDAVAGKSGLDPARQTAEDWSREIRTRFERAVERRMMADVPYGVFLSGGIDSTANVAAMSRLSPHPVKTFTVGFTDHTRLNETGHARDVADEFKTDHHEVLIDGDDMQGYLADLVHQQDEPIADWVCVPLYFVSKLARESGVTVVQVGEGSDEQFAGYQSYMTYLRLGRALSGLPLATAARLARPLAGALARLTPGRTSSMERVEEVLLRLSKGAPLFWGGSNAFWGIHQDRYLNAAAAPCHPDDVATGVDGLSVPGLEGGDGGALIQGYRDAADAAASGRGDELTRMIHTEFRLRLPELLLMRVDKITMSTSIEGRVPFLDHELVDLTMDIPAAMKIGNLDPKRLLKQAFTGMVPERILNRPKMGFGAPVAEWLKEDFGRDAERRILQSPLTTSGPLNGSYIRDRFRDHREGRADNALHLWVLFNLAAWYDHWIDGPATT
jgi:asparagine synthase (glutamine-hydrolysing)